MLSSFPRSYPGRPAGLETLAKLQLLRYDFSDQKEDLDKCILYCTEAILLLICPWYASCINIVEVLLRLASGLIRRSTSLNQLDDANSSVECLLHVRRLPLGSLHVPRHVVTTLLVQALAAQVELEVGDETPNTREMVVLCRELLTSDIPASHQTTAITALSRAVVHRFFQRKRVRPLDEVIGCLRDAAKISPPGLHVVAFALVYSLFVRFLMIHSIDDYEEAMAILERSMTLRPPGDGSASSQIEASRLAIMLANARSTLYENPEYSEETISRCRTYLSSSSPEDQLRPMVTEILATQVGKRSMRFGLTGLREKHVSGMVGPSPHFPGSGKGISLFSPTVRAASSSEAVEENIQHLKGLLSTISPGTSHYRVCLEGLGDWYETKFSRTGDVVDIEEVIKYRRMLISSIHPNDQFVHLPVVSLGRALSLAFELTKRNEYLNESISVHRSVLKMPGTRPLYFPVIQRLVLSLFARFLRLALWQDLNEVIQLLPVAVNDQYTTVLPRFGGSCFWAYIARRANHPSVSTAYETAMSLMQSSLLFAPTLQIQHSRLVAMGDHTVKMPLDYASYLVHIGQFERAIETLERGRALLWSEMRGLRTAIDQLLKANSSLAEKFANINRELETVTTSVLSGGDVEVGDGEEPVGDDTDRMDSFGHLVVKQRKLLEKRDALISQIQRLPGLEGFSKTPSFDTLRSAASRGPVVIINHSEWRSDMLVLLHDSPPSLIPTPEDFYDRASRLKDQLLNAQKKCGLDSRQYELALRSVLADLYQLVGRPVIDKLCQLGIPEQSRIWWCPTSVFCSLPLHAMGPVPSGDNIKRYFSDLYISSYTTTLSALIQSRNPGAHAPVPPSLLLVAQPDATLPGVRGEIKVVQGLGVQATSLVSKGATCTTVVDGLRNHPFVHFACHGTLETGKPFDASFELYGDERLSLLDIVKTQLPAAEFAFLSACHTAELTDESIADEGLHLAAAMQYCGFRSVVGTMWAMADTDGRDLARDFYRSMLSSRQDQGVAYYEYERSAKALRDSVQRLRGKRGVTLERWVNFVHYGA